MNKQDRGRQAFFSLILTIDFQISTYYWSNCQPDYYTCRSCCTGPHQKFSRRIFRFLVSVPLIIGIGVAFIFQAIISGASIYL